MIGVKSTLVLIEGDANLLSAHTTQFKLVILVVYKTFQLWNILLVAVIGEEMYQFLMRSRDFYGF